MAIPNAPQSLLRNIEIATISITRDVSHIYLLRIYVSRFSHHASRHHQSTRPIIRSSIIPIFRHSDIPIRAITFDVGGTLIEPWPSVGHVYAAVAARQGLLGLPVDLLNRQFAAAWKNLTHFNYTRAEWFNIVNQTFLGLAPTPLADALFSDLYREFARARAWRLFDDVLPALELLKSRKLKLGIISNWDERLRPLLHHLKLAHFFHTIVISCEGGPCKPSIAIFQQAAQTLGPHPGEILHIGDSATIDIDGATAAGFQALLLSRNEGTKPGQLNSLLELPPHLHQ